MTTIDDFLRTGCLGPIASGMPEVEIRGLLGEPDSVSTQKTPRLLKYGSLQLAFYKLPDGAEPLLVSQTLYYHHPQESPPAALAMTGWAPFTGTTFDEFRAHLDDEKIPVVGGVASGPQQYLVLGSGVRATFDDEQIYSLGYTSKREPEYKQLTVKVRRKDLDLIHQWAKGRHVSASELCSEWIKEQVSQMEKMGMT